MTLYRYLFYTLELHSPAIITILGGEPNSSITLPFVSGSALRGAIAKVLGDPGTDDYKRKEFCDLVLGSKVRYFNAYPCLNGERALPIPVSLRLNKDYSNDTETVQAIDLAGFDGHPSPDMDLKECWPEEQLKSFGREFVTMTARPVILSSKISARIHHQRDRQKGRAWKDTFGNTHGAIFVFESLDAGQSFQGVIQIRDNSEEELTRTENRIKELLGDTILVGRSRRAGYGGMAQIKWNGQKNREVVGVGSEGLRPVSSNITKGNQFRLLLTSACIARHTDTGQIDPAALPKLIEQLFGGRAVSVRKRWSFEYIGGFNRKWRLEVPQVLAVSAGSVFVLEARQNIPFDDLLAIEHEGLGEKREEGYGRVLFLDAPLQRIYLYKPEQVIQQLSGDKDIPKTVTDIEQRIVWAQTVRKIEETAATIVSCAKNIPSNSLIGRLRTPLRGKYEDAITTLKIWLSIGDEKKRLKQPAMEQLKRCEMGEGIDLHSWILDVIDDNKVLQLLNVDVLAQFYHIVSEQSAKKILEDRVQEISVRLIDAVLAALAVRNKTEGAGDAG